MRIAMKVRNILVVGGTGFVGRHLVTRLAAEGRNVIVPTRNRARARSLILLPTVDVQQVDVNEREALDAVVAGQDAVINLVGILHGDRAPEGAAYGKAFRRAHVDLPRRLVEACQRNNVPRLLHMSALGASGDAPSMYLRSKADGEAAVLAPFLLADGRPLLSTVFRPSVIFGPGDSLLTLFAKLQRWFPVLPLAGAETRFQPVYVGDVVKAFVAALDDVQLTPGRAIELGGPDIYTLREIAAMAGSLAGCRRPIFGVSDGMARLQAAILRWLPGPPLLSADNLDSLKRASVLTAPLDAPLIAALGLQQLQQMPNVARDMLTPPAALTEQDRRRRLARRELT